MIDREAQAALLTLLFLTSCLLVAVKVFLPSEFTAILIIVSLAIGTIVVGTLLFLITRSVYIFCWRLLGSLHTAINRIRSHH